MLIDCLNVSQTLSARWTAIRLVAFLSVFAATALCEAVAPRRQRSYSRMTRWPSNFAIAAINALAVRIVEPAMVVASALLERQWGWGFINDLRLPAWATIVLSIVLLDLAIYLQHVMFHAIPALWRVHRMHHADLDFDTSTGVRFHPVEAILSMLIKLSAVAVLGAPAMAVLIFAVLLNASSMFNHGNLRMPVMLDRYLRWLLVTPDMHRVHHSILPAEANSNFGFNLPWWDRLFGTYRGQPGSGHESMIIGIEQFRHERELWLPRMLVQPLRGPVGAYAIAGEKAA
ncbi:MAG: sterol desaturase family protein [Deltaproteobacteria bacterium]|nr:sterol desaturase family protein [Deltaproteobacteria bacterium]